VKHWAGIFLVLFCISGLAYADESARAPATQMPVVREVTGSGAINLEAALYPRFTDIKPSANTDTGCQSSEAAVFQALAGKPITTVSPSTGKAVAANTALLGLQPTDLKFTLTATEVPDAYRTTTKIMVTWTVRIEGACPAWGVGHTICEPWIGDLTFDCPQGDVKTYLYAQYKVNNQTVRIVLGPESTMTMPKSTTGPVKQVDPTLTGMYVITAADFPDKKIPENLELQIYWENFSAMKIVSPDKMRNMLVNIMPVTK